VRSKICSGKSLRLIGIVIYNIGHNLKNLNDQGLHETAVSIYRKITAGIHRVESVVVLLVMDLLRPTNVSLWRAG